MTRLIHLVSVMVLGLLLTACDNDSYRDHQGNSGSFADYRGQWLVINYWAAWCKPCIEEIPELNRLAQNQRDKMVVFGVDYDNSEAEKLRQSIDSLDIRFPVLSADPAPLLRYKRPAVLPTTVLIDPDGKLHKTLVGPQTEAKLLKAMGLTEG